MNELLTTATAWLVQHPYWILAVVCGVAFLESFFVIGVLMPGAIMLFALGALAGGLQLPQLPLLFFAAAGAVAGDVSSFFIGRALEHSLHDRPASGAGNRSSPRRTASSKSGESSAWWQDASSVRRAPFFRRPRAPRE